MVIIWYLIGSFSSYFIIKLAVKHAINESLEDIKSIINQAIVEGLSEHEYKKENK